MTELPTPTTSLSGSFYQRMTHSTVSGNGVAFPFATTTAAARNPQYDRENRNNQDTVGICTRPHFIAAVVCDGCGSTHEVIDRCSVSSNEVGAKLACSLILNEVEKALAQVKPFSGQELVRGLSRRLQSSFKKTVKAFCGDDEAKAETFIRDFLMTTVVGFIVTKDQFVVFHSGDGVIAVDGKFDILDSEEGQYFGRDLFPICCPSKFQKGENSNDLKVHASGKADALQSIFVASDGMARLVRQCPKEMSEFVNRVTPREQCEAGFDFALPEFRREIAHVSVELTDDASFALVRRVSQTVEAAC